MTDSETKAERKPHPRKGTSKYEIPSPWAKRYSRHKAQAIYRGETHQLSPQEYLAVWQKSGKMDDVWTMFKGKQGYVLKRLDEKGAWCVSNVCIVPRNCYSQSKRRRYAEIGYQEV